MSSWANRLVPRKRDLSQIPEPFRPQIIPRVQRSEIVQSEAYQLQDTSYKSDEYSFKNEIVENNRSKPDMNINPREYITKKVVALPNLSAVELSNKGKSYVFVILRHIRNVRDNDLWISSYNSIRKFYTNKIVIIDDNSNINTVNGKLINAEVIYSEFNGAGEILPYYYFLQNKWADTMIFLHDTMFLNRPFKTTELESPIRFHWYFNKSASEDYRKISNYISVLKNNTDLLAGLKTDINWRGCFGVTTIADLDVIQNLEDKYKLFSSLALSIKTRKDRETFERVFGIVLYFETLVDNTTVSNFGDILKYPGAFDSENNNYETGARIVQQKGYDTAIIKVWRGR